MSKIKSNPYVYPYVPFYDLGDKTFKAKFIGEEKINIREIKRLLGSVKQLKINPKGSSPEEKVLNLFLDKKVLFGPKGFITKDKDFWLNAFRFFIKREEPIQFSILGFPFKMPVPLKTDRTTPDMGEVLMLKRLFEITLLIKDVYKKGAHITVFAEGVFGRFNDQPEREYKKYFSTLKKITKSLGFGRSIEIRELEEMEKTTKTFKKIFRNKVNLYEQKVKDADPEFMQKYMGVRESLERIVNTRKYKLSEHELMDLYNQKKSNAKISEKLKKVRRAMEKAIKKLAINYFAYLKVRDDIGFLEKSIPKVITLSVSPKPGRLGVLPIDENCIRLAYHGVPVYDQRQKIFTIEYLIDIKRKEAKYKKVFLKDFPEPNKPFYYIRQ